MKIEWLNTECSRARITVGWLRKRQAVVTRIPFTYSPDDWELKSGARLGVFRRDELNTARSEELRRGQELARGPDWEPVAKIPRARLLRG